MKCKVFNIVIFSALPTVITPAWRSRWRSPSGTRAWLSSRTNYRSRRRGYSRRSRPQSERRTHRSSWWKLYHNDHSKGCKSCCSHPSSHNSSTMLRIKLGLLWQWVKRGEWWRWLWRKKRKASHWEWDRSPTFRNENWQWERIIRSDFSPQKE